MKRKWIWRLAAFTMAAVLAVPTQSLQAAASEMQIEEIVSDTEAQTEESEVYEEEIPVSIEDHVLENRETAEFEITEETSTENEAAEDHGYRVPDNAGEEANEKWKAQRMKEGRSSRYLSSGIENDYLEVAVEDEDDYNSGRFTIGNKIGNPNYSSDDDQNLLFGHPAPGTSETLIKIGDEELFFQADRVTIDQENNKILSYMNINEYNVQIVQTLEFARSGAANIEDMVKISYKVNNRGNVPRSVGIRIMLDTMLSYNDAAPFKVAGVGNVTSRREYTGSHIPASYQVYDDLDNPSTIATGVVYRSGERKPDKVQFTNWGTVHGASWNYTHYEGSGLGDSAVAFYYNPVRILSGGSSSVSTYYGVGMGTIIDAEGNIVDSNFSVGENEMAVRVRSLNSGNSVEGVAVTIKNNANGKTVSQITDSSGYALFKEAKDLEGSCDITISKADYKEKTVKGQKMQCKRVISMTIQGTNENRPEIQKIEMNGKNLLNEVVTYAENKEGVEANDNNSSVVTMKVSSTRNNCVYQLIQDGEVIQKNTSGEFKLTVLNKNAAGKEYSVKRIKDLSAGSLLYVLCISEEGYRSEKTRIGLKVTEPSSAASTTKTSFTLGSKPTLKLNGDKMNPVEKFFLGDSEISIGADTFPVEVECSDEGKIKIRINKNSEQEKEDFDKKIKDVRKEIRKLKGFGGKFFRVAQPIKLDFGFAGYGEGYLKDGQAVINVEVMGYIKAGTSWTTQFVFGTFPCYVKTTVEGKMEVTAAANVRNQNGWNFDMTRGSIEPTVTGKVEVGAGLSGILSASIEGSGDIAFHNNLVNGYYKLSTTLAAKLKARALFFEYNKTIAQYTKVWLDGYASRQAKDEEALFTMEELYDLNNYQMIGREYLNLSETGKKDKSVKEWNADTINVRQNVFVNAMPQFVEAGGTYYYFWIDDANNIASVPNRSLENRTVLVYSHYDNNTETWSEPEAIKDDKTADFYFDLAVSQGKIYVVWQNTNQVFPEGSSLSPEEVFAAADISAAVLNTADQKITQLSVSTTDQADILPKIAAKNGKAAIAWYSNQGGSITPDGNAQETYQIHRASLSGTAFKENSVTKTAEGAITDLDIGYMDGSPVIAYTADINQNAADSADREIFILQGDNALKLTENAVTDSAPRFVEEGSSTVLYWYQDNKIAYVSRLTDVPSYVEVKEETGLSDDFVVLTDATGSRKKIVWVSYSSEYAKTDEEMKAAYAIDWDGKKWSQAYELDGVGTGNIASLSGVLGTDGKEMISFQKLEYTENYKGEDIEQDNISELLSSGLYITSSQERESIVLEDVIYDENQVEPGGVLPVTLVVTNKGNTPINQFNVSIGNDTVTVETDIPVGGTQSVQVKEYIVPEDLTEVMDLSVSVSLPSKSADKSQAEDFRISVGYTDVEVTETERVIIDNIEYAVMDIKNNSSLPAKNVNLKLIADVEDGQVVFDHFIKELKAKEVRTVFCPMDSLVGCTVVYMRLTTDSSEKYTENNNGILVTSNETVDLDTTGMFTIQPENQEAGSVSYQKPEAEEIVAAQGDAEEILNGEPLAIKAVPKEGFVFTGWTQETTEGNKKGTLENKNKKSTTFVMPPNDVKLVAHFATANISSAITDITNKIEMKPGDAELLQPVVNTSNGQLSTDYLMWESDHTEIATVSEDGLVTAVSPGEAKVTATVIQRGKEDQKTNLSYQYEIVVTKKEITGLRFTYPSIELNGAGAEYNLNEDLVVLPEDGKAELVWESSEPSVVQVDESGKLVAQKAGAVKITAKLKGQKDIKAECTVIVKLPITGISLDAESLELQKYDERTLNVSVNPVNTTDEIQVVWETTDSSVVEIQQENNQNATIRAVGGGSCTIIASIGDFTAACSVRVRNMATGIRIEPAVLTLDKFQNYYLDTYLTPYDADDIIEWSSSNPAVVEVNDYGDISGRTAGTATITARIENGMTASCRVTVRPYGAIMELPDYADLQNVSSWQEMESDFTSKDHQYPNYMEKIWTYKINGAKSIKIHFNSKSGLEYGSDYIYILDGSNRKIEEYTGDEIADQWVTVEGDTLKIWMQTDYSVTDYGFKVDDCTIEYHPVDIKSASLKVGTQYYNGKALVPEPVITFGNATLKKNQDYVLSYGNNVNIGTASVTATGRGRFTGTITGSFKIVLAPVTGLRLKSAKTTMLTLTWNKVPGATGYKVYKYDSKKKKNILLKNIKKSGTNQFTVKKLKKVTTYTYFVEAYRTSGGKTYEGESAARLKTATCSLAPTIKVKRISSRKAQISWSKVKGINGYEVYMSRKKTSGYKRVATVKSARTKTYKKGRLAKKKTYYFKVRTYKSVDGKKIYSSFSKVKSVKMK